MFRKLFQCMIVIPCIFFCQLFGTTTQPVGMKQIEYQDSSRDNRPIVISLFYPAIEVIETPFIVPYNKGFQFYENADISFNGKKYPLIVFSHGRGGNRFNQAWLATFLASQGYIVAALDHFLATSYDQSLEYLASKIWERPLDVKAAITYLLTDPTWSLYIDSEEIGVAGFSQGGFTALWAGGAKVNPDKFESFQELIRKNPILPQYFKYQLPVSAIEAEKVSDDRIKAVFAMAPGMVQEFGFDQEGLKELKVPTYIIAGAKDAPVPIEENAKFAAKYIPKSELTIIPGDVGHYVFLNEGTDEGKREFSESFIDAPSVNRKQIHELIEKEATKFFDTHLKHEAAPSLNEGSSVSSNVF